MTNRDKILAPVAIVILIVSGLIVYKGYFNQEINTALDAPPDTEANQKSIVNLLPYGRQLDFSRIQNRSKQLSLTPQSIFNYPTTSEAEVGIEPGKLFGE